MRKQLRGPVAVGAALVLSLAACSSGAKGPTTPTSTGPVTLTYWSDANNIDKVVAVWNSQHPEIHVELTDPGSTDDMVAKILTANQGGTAPDVADVPQNALAQLVVGGGAKDLTGYLKGHTDVFSTGSLDAVTLDGKTYAMPFDVAPMMLVYRKDILDSLGLQAPTTWEEFRTVAQQVRQKDPKRYLAQFDPTNYYLFTGMVEQLGGSWWTVKDGKWVVDIDGAASMKVAAYWQDLVDNHLVSTKTDWTPEWSTQLNDGSILTGPMAVWGVGSVTSLAPKAAGKWRAAAVPTWQGGGDIVGQDGGTCTVITTSSKKADAAAKFILWLEAGDGAKELGKTQYPASIPAHDSLTTPPAGIQGQTDFYQLASASVGKLASVTWGPDTTVAFRTFSDAFTAAYQNHTSLQDALRQVQDATVKDMQSKGFTVTEGS